MEGRHRGTIGGMERERCSAHRRDGEPCGAKAIKGGNVCRVHGGSALQVRRNAERLQALREFYASLPFLQKWTGELVSGHENYVASFIGADRPRRCRARRKDGQPCRCWAIRGGYVCRVHGGAAPQVRRKAAERLLSAKIYREMYAASGRCPVPTSHQPGA